MTRWYRTVAAFLIAPSTAPIIYGAIAATRRPPGEGPTWIGSFGQWFVIVGMVSYGLSFIIGIPACVCLRLLNRESVLVYAAISGIAGFLYLPVINIFRSFSPELAVISLIFALLGTTVGVAFALIAGRANSSNQSPDPALSSGTSPAGQEPRHP